jgi:hypothetical protein
VGALSFTVTVLATVGFGDVVALVAVAGFFGSERADPGAGPGHVHARTAGSAPGERRVTRPTARRAVRAAPVGYHRPARRAPGP